jgi:hypothetical protein
VSYFEESTRKRNRAPSPSFWLAGCEVPRMRVVGGRATIAVRLPGRCTACDTATFAPELGCSECRRAA